MHAVIVRLISGLHRIADDQQRCPLNELINDSFDGLSPQAAWLLICLLREHLRVIKADELVREHLLAPGEELADAMRPYGESGFLGGQPDISYEFTGGGVRLRNRGSGQSTHLSKSFPLKIYVHDMTRFLYSESDYGFPEKRLRSFHSDLGSLEVSAMELEQFGFTRIQSAAKTDPETFTDEHAPLIDAWTALEPHLPDAEVQKRLAVLLGDFQYVHEQGDGSESISKWNELKDASQERRRRFVLSLPRTEFVLPSIIHALGDIDAPEFEGAIEEALYFNPRSNHWPNSAPVEAMKLIASKRLAKFYPPICSFLRRADNNIRQDPRRLWHRAVRTLLEFDFCRETALKELECAPVDWVARAALLSLEHAPELSKSLFRRALVTGFDAEPRDAAEVLAILDEGWSRELLIEQLSTSTNPQLCELCHAALLESHSQEIRTNADLLFANRYEELGYDPEHPSTSLQRFRVNVIHRSEEIFPLRGRVK